MLTIMIVFNNFNSGLQVEKSPREWWAEPTLLSDGGVVTDAFGDRYWDGDGRAVGALSLLGGIDGHERGERAHQAVLQRQRFDLPREIAGAGVPRGPVRQVGDLHPRPDWTHGRVLGPGVVEIHRQRDLLDLAGDLALDLHGRAPVSGELPRENDRAADEQVRGLDGEDLTRAHAAPVDRDVRERRMADPLEERVHHRL